MPTTETVSPATLPTSGPGLVWTLSFVDINPEDRDCPEIEVLSIPGGYEALREWLIGYVRHGMEPRSTLSVRWIEPHSVGYIVRDADGVLSARATLTAAESDVPPPRIPVQDCCDREMSVTTIAFQYGDTPMLLCHECGHREPRY